MRIAGAQRFRLEHGGRREQCRRFLQPSQWVVPWGKTAAYEVYLMGPRPMSSSARRWRMTCRDYNLPCSRVEASSSSHLNVPFTRSPKVRREAVRKLPNICWCLFLSFHTSGDVSLALGIRRQVQEQAAANPSQRGRKSSLNKSQLQCLPLLSWRLHASRV